MKHALAAGTILALLAPLFAAAAGPTIRIIEAGRSSKIEIVSLGLSGNKTEEPTLDWTITGDARLEFAVRCSGGERLRAEHADGTVSYVPCDGKTHAAYRDDFSLGALGDVTFTVTGDKKVRVATILKVYPDAGKRLIDSARQAVVVLPQEEGED
jgi:hypothetical protein